MGVVRCSSNRDSVRVVPWSYDSLYLYGSGTITLFVPHLYLSSFCFVGGLLELPMWLTDGFLVTFFERWRGQCTCTLLTCGGNIHVWELLTCGGNIHVWDLLMCGGDIHMWDLLTCGGDIHMWELFMCGGDIHVWELLTCGGDIHVWELLTCGGDIHMWELLTCGGDIHM